MHVEGRPSHLKRLRVSEFNIIHCLWTNISEFSLFFHINLHGDHIPSSTTNSRLVNSFYSQIYPNSFSFSFSKYPVVLTFFILFAGTWLCVPSFSWILDYRCTDILSLTLWIRTYPRKIKVPLSDPHCLQIPG